MTQRERQLEAVIGDVKRELQRHRREPWARELLLYVLRLEGASQDAIDEVTSWDESLRLSEEG